MSAPLAGVRVIDLTRLVAGNMASMVLADLGATVVKVEAPTGDSLRQWEHDSVPLFWLTYGRNKTGETIDIRSPEGRSALLRLCSTADVLLESFKPGTLERYGLPDADLREDNPELTIVHITAWGNQGPMAEFAGFGTLVEAFSGFAAANGEADGGPLLPPISLADMVAGLYAAIGAVSALAEVPRAGRRVDVSLLESMTAILGPQAEMHRRTGWDSPRMGNRHPSAAPRGLYECADGEWIALSASTQAATERLFAAIGMEELLSDRSFATNEARLENVDELDHILSGYFSQRSRDDLLNSLQPQGVTVGPVNRVGDLLVHPHAQALGLFQTLHDPEYGEVLVPRPMPRISGHDPRPSPAPGPLALGEK